MQGCAQNIERKLKFRNRQEAEAETKHPRLFGEPCAIADTGIEGGECRMKAEDGSLVELLRPQAYAAKRARIRVDPFDQRRVARNPRRSPRKTFAEMVSTGSDDRVRLDQDAKPQHFVDGRIGDYRVEFPEHHLLAQGLVADDRPADAQARRAVAF